MAGCPFKNICERYSARSWKCRSSGFVDCDEYHRLLEETILDEREIGVVAAE